MTAGDCLCKLGEMVDDDQDAGVVVVWGAGFQVVVLDQFIEVSALDVFQMESDVARLVQYLLTGEALANITAHTASNARPCVAFLNSCHHLGYALVSHGVMCAE